jgi:Phage integrase family
VTGVNFTGRQSLDRSGPGSVLPAAPGASGDEKTPPPELLGHLRRWQRRGQRFCVEWNGEPVKAIRKGFAAAAGAAGVGPDVTPHTLRHTAATWLMQQGTDAWEAAGYLGMTMEMLSHRYGHHHPDHLSGARLALGRHRNRHRNAATEREQTTSNVAKIAEFSKGAR